MQEKNEISCFFHFKMQNKFQIDAKTTCFKKKQRERILSISTILKQERFGHLAMFGNISGCYKLGKGVLWSCSAPVLHPQPGMLLRLQCIGKSLTTKNYPVQNVSNANKKSCSNQKGKNQQQLKIHNSIINNIRNQNDKKVIGFFKG